VDREERPPAASDNEGEHGGHSQADRLVLLARESYDFGVSQTGELFGVSREGPRIARLLRGSATSLRAELARTYFVRHGKTPSSSALADAITTLHGFAMLAEPTTLHIRQARLADAIWIDLGEVSGAAVRTDASGWTIEAGAPTVFRRSELTGPLPAPKAGDVDELRAFLNVTDEGWALIVGWLVSACIPDIPHPIMALTGEQGTAKSTTARLLTSLIDPSPAPLRPAPRDVNEWVTVADGSCLVGLDNLSHLPGWLSDALCRAVTGEGLPRRRLYTDGDLVVTSFRKLILLTGIDFGALSADLVDRTVFVELQRIPRDRRILDSDLEERFGRARPRILGGLLDLVSATLRSLPTAELSSYPRMADHARVLSALDDQTGGMHLAAYERTAGRAMVDAAEGNPVAEAVLTYMQGHPEWTGTASDLLAIITPERPPKGWPGTPSHLSGTLLRVAPALRECGVQIDHGQRIGHERTRLITLTRERPADGADGDSRLLLSKGWLVE
jgi:hypothetical protein